MCTVSWTEKKTNVESLNTVNSRRKFIGKIKMSRPCEKVRKFIATTGRIEGERSSGRQRIKIQNYSAERTDPTKREKDLQNPSSLNQVTNYPYI